MVLTQIKSSCRHQPSRHSQVALRSRRATALVPKAKVQEMLREIAFVLHATRRISRDVRESKSGTEGTQPCSDSQNFLETK